MSTTESGHYIEPNRPSGWAVGLSVFAGAMMLVVGGFQILQGIVAIANDEFYVRTSNYTFNIDTTQWGWVHLLLGVVVALVGIGVLLGALWARIVGVVLVLFQMFANFMFLPYYPLWSIVVIALTWPSCGRLPKTRGRSTDRTPHCTRR